MYCCCFKKRKDGPTEEQRVNHPSPVWACALDSASGKRSWLPTCLLLVLLLLAGSRTTSGFPTAIPALEPTLAARSTCATRDVTRWFSRWWSGSIVSTPTSKAAVVLFIQSTYKTGLSCGVALFSFKSTRRLDSCGVSDGLPPTRLVSSRHNRRLSDGIPFHRSSVFLAIAYFGATVAGQSVMGLRLCSTSQCRWSIPMWNLNLQLRRIAIQKWRQQRLRICSVRSLCVASVVLALVFMPGLYSSIAYRATFPAFFMRFPLEVCFYCLCDFVCVFYFFCLSRRCPLLATFLSGLFCLLSLLISKRISGLIWFGSVYLVTTAGFIADQLMWNRHFFGSATNALNVRNNTRIICIYHFY